MALLSMRFDIARNAINEIDNVLTIASRTP
jgi:hypothetical protein